MKFKEEIKLQFPMKNLVNMNVSFVSWNEDVSQLSTGSINENEGSKVKNIYVELNAGNIAYLNFFWN